MGDMQGLFRSLKMVGGKIITPINIFSQPQLEGRHALTVLNFLLFTRKLPVLFLFTMDTVRLPVDIIEPGRRDG